jgi:hypothetical protein
MHLGPERGAYIYLVFLMVSWFTNTRALYLIIELNKLIELNKQKNLPMDLEVTFWKFSLKLKVSTVSIPSEPQVKPEGKAESPTLYYIPGEKVVPTVLEKTWDYPPTN